VRPDADDPAFQQFLKEIDDHFVYVVGDLLGWKVTGTPEFGVGSGNVVIRFENQAGGRYLFRVPRFAQDPLRRVALAYRHFGASGLLPEQIYIDGKCALERYAQGVALSDRSPDPALASLGRALAKIHAVSGEGFGPLSHGTSGGFVDARAYYAQSVFPASVDDADEDLDEQQAGTLERLAQRARQLPAALHDAPVRLGHGDMWRRNIVVNADGGITLIDWDRIGCYPREYDFIFMVDADLSPQQKKLVLGAYGEDLDAQLLDWFSLRRLMGDPAASGRDKLATAARHGLLE
jgi:aminoglycoside phosphotransferase (APT) family kinase protein